MSLTLSPAEIVEQSRSPLVQADPRWARVPLGSVATILNGAAFKSDLFRDGDGVPLIRIRDIRSENTTVRYAGPFDDRYLIAPGELLVGMDGDFNVARWKGPTALLNQRVCCLRTDEGALDIDFLSWVLPGYLQAIHDVTSSTTVKHLSSRDIAAIPIPLPELAEQRLIATWLAELDARSKDVADRLTASRAIVDRLRAAVLAAACSGRLSTAWREVHSPNDAQEAIDAKRAVDRVRLGRKYVERVPPSRDQLPAVPDSWTWALLSELGQLGRGKSKHRPRNDPALYGGEYPFIQTGDVAAADGRVSEHIQTYNEAGLSQSRLWPAGTVCITIAANIAESAILSYPACFPDSVVGLITDPDVVVPEYVELFIRTARRDLAAFAPATAQANINLSILSNVAVPVPSLDEQQEIVRLAGSALNTAERIHDAASDANAALARTTRGALGNALRGRLMPADHDLRADVSDPLVAASRRL